MIRPVLALSMLVLLACCSGCGNKGPLYLPELGDAPPHSPAVDEEKDD